MSADDVAQLVRLGSLRSTNPDPETARSEIAIARRHIDSAGLLIASDPALAFVALYDAMRKAIAAHARSRGYRVAGGPGGHVRTGLYAAAALDHLGIDDHLAEFDVLRDSATRVNTTPSGSSLRTFAGP